MSEIKTIRCNRCRSEFTDKETEGFSGCPKCGTTSVPEKISQDVEVKINWHELRILTIWAEHYANSIENTSKGSVECIFGICDRLQKQHPHLAPLTLSAELQQLKDAFGKVEVTGKKIKEGGPMPPKIN